MIFSLVIVLIFFWLIQRQWKMRKLLKLSRMLQTKYRAWPIIGHGLMFLGSAEDRMQTVDKLSRETIKSENGLASIWLGTKFCVATCDPLIAEVIAKTSLEKPKEIYIAASHLIGNSSVFAPVNIWRPRRKILGSLFSTKVFRSFVEVLAEQNIILTECLKSEVDNGTFSAWKYLASFTLDIIFKSTLDFNLNAQKHSLHPILSTVEMYFKIIPFRIIQPSVHLDWLMNFVPEFKNAKENVKMIHDFINEAIKDKRISLEHEHKKYINSDSQDHTRPTSLLDELIKMSSGMANGSRGLTDIELDEEILLILIAGNGTTAITASFIIAMLSKHLDVQEKAYDEIHNVFGDSKRPVAYEDFSKLNYIEALINETLRLFPPIPIIMRQHDADVKLASGITIPAGASSIISIWGIQRHPRYWGADAEEFNPDRFLNGTQADPRAFMAFSYGPRNCVGKKYSMMLLKGMVVTLLQNYKVLPSSDVCPEDLKKPLRLGYSIMLKDLDNFKVRLDHRL